MLIVTYNPQCLLVHCKCSIVGASKTSNPHQPTEVNQAPGALPTLVGHVTPWDIEKLGCAHLLQKKWL